MKITIIGEIGVNHNGKISQAKKIVLAAKKIGLKIVKFQFYNTEKLVLPFTPMAKYQLRNYSKKKKFNQFKMLKKFELSPKEHLELSKFCYRNEIEYCCSLFHEDDVSYVKKLKLKRIKIPSGEINNFFLLRKVAKLNKKLILSTGMSNDYEINRSIKFLVKNGQDKNKITLLHCSSAYPTPMKNLNLNTITYLRKKYKISVGFSDHSKEVLAPILAIAKGAEVIEKHITLSNNLVGPDHKASLSIKDFKKMIQIINKSKTAFGLNKKIINKLEKQNIYFARKSLVAKKFIKKGTKFTYNNLTGIRPLSGNSLNKINNFLGKKAKKNYNKNEII
jgi:N,N'-diacetyllegionaminate synthase